MSEQKVQRPAHRATAFCEDKKMTDTMSTTAPQPATQSIPASISKDIKLKDSDVTTTVVVQKFVNRTFVVLTNYKRFGSLIQCEVEESQVDKKTLNFHIQTLLGKHDDALNEVYARQISERIYRLEKDRGGLAKKPLLLGIALKDDLRTSESFKVLVDFVLSLYEYLDIN